MLIKDNLPGVLFDFVDERKGRLIEILSELIRLPSENTPPDGAEKRCQQWLARQLEACGLIPDLYLINEVAELHEHLLYFPGRNYASRPNLGALRKGKGLRGGKSLLLAGHVDTVPAGTQPWTRSPFGAEIEGDRLYGRGANDMKAGLAMNLFVLECLAELKVPLAGDLRFESVVDEEFGGSNGTLAGRLRGNNADAAILAEPSNLRVCPAQRGGRTAHLRFQAPPAGVLENGNFPTGAIPQLIHFLSAIKEFAAQRTANCVSHEMYASSLDPVPVSVTKVFTSPWGPGEPITIPETALVELYWQLMPGETQAGVEQEFFSWLTNVVAGAPDIFSGMPEVTLPIRWLPGSAISRSEPLIGELIAAAQKVMGREPTVTGFEAPCDLFIFQQGFGIPAVIWGPSGGNTHGPDEYVEIDSLVIATKTLLNFVVNWCGLADT